ncbi:hypothetical protein QJS10_CPB12g01760 [Acorus calamus]|uniref:Uncharacterized protein n=1 Tax=Acorus calamus TaxID=4465 RepID=A0AAV9DMV4_ACOCL|nr:hypothetical protein QJS10_CPB12g01760 [Acorus calamus]
MMDVKPMDEGSMLASQENKTSNLCTGFYIDDLGTSDVMDDGLMMFDGGEIQLDENLMQGGNNDHEFMPLYVEDHLSFDGLMEDLNQCLDPFQSYNADDHLESLTNFFDCEDKFVEKTDSDHNVLNKGKPIRCGERRVRQRSRAVDHGSIALDGRRTESLKATFEMPVRMEDEKECLFGRADGHDHCCLKA